MAITRTASTIAPGHADPDSRGAVDVQDVREAPGPARDSEPEAWLRAAAVGGDRAAFAALYLAYRNYVLGYLVRRCRGDRHLAEDLTQDTFTRAFTGLSRYRETGRPFGAWLVTIAGNLLVDYWRSGWRRYQVPWHDFTQDGEDGWPVMDAATDPATEVVAWDRQQHVARTLARAVARLSDRQQAVVSLRYVGGLSVTETAHLLGLGEGAVKAAAYRARQALADDPTVVELR